MRVARHTTYVNLGFKLEQDKTDEGHTTKHGDTPSQKAD